MDYNTISATRFLSYWQRPVLRPNDIFDAEIESFVFLKIDSLLELKGEFPEVLRITDSKFGAVHVLESSFDQNITFRDCIFEGDFIIEGGKFKSMLHFLNCEFRDNFIIRDGNFDTIIFDNSLCSKQAKITGGIIKKFIYASANEKTIFKVEGRFTFINSLKLTSVLGMTFFSKHCIINNLLIEGYYNTASRIDFLEIKCYEVAINNVNNDGKIYFSNFNHCLVDELKPVPLSDIEIDQALNDDEESLYDEIKKNLILVNNIKLYNHFFFSSLRKELLYEKTRASTFIFSNALKKNSLFSITNCSLGILELRDIPLENMGVKALSSDLSFVKLINTRFPLKIESYNVLNEYYIYNDIYTSASRQNNYRDKIEYYRVSQQALFKNIIKEGRFNSFPSYISILVSKLASNHGSNWGQAFLMTFAVGILFFSLFVVSFEDISFDLSCEGRKYFYAEILPYFPQFFNPLHKLEFMNDVSKNFGGWTGFVDISGRLFISIGIFEMVRSFRKFVRN